MSTPGQQHFSRKTPDAPIMEVPMEDPKDPEPIKLFFVPDGKNFFGVKK